MLLLLLLVAGLVVSGRLLMQFNESRATDEQVERDLRLRTGGKAGEDAYELARLLIAEGVPLGEAVDVAATLSFLGSGALADLETARLLARFEQDASADARPSSDLVGVAEQLEVGGDGLRSFVNQVSREATERQMPVEPLMAGLQEHGLEYAVGCELAEQQPCPVDMTVQLALDRQQADYEQWGHVDCRAADNIAHPACLTFPDCAAEYALWLAGHDEVHETCIANRYGEGIDAYKALVLER